MHNAKEKTPTKRRAVLKPCDVKLQPKKTSTERKSAVKHHGAKLPPHKSTSVIQEQRVGAFTVAKSDNYSPVSPTVIIWLLTSVLLLICILWYVYHYFNQHLSHNAELEDIKFSTVESLKTLKRHTLQCNHTIYKLLVIFIVLVVSLVVALVVFYKDASNHKSKVAAEALARQKNDYQSQLKDQSYRVTCLENKVQDYEDEIEQLQHQNSKKEAELSATKAELKIALKRLGEAIDHNRKLQAWHGAAGGNLQPQFGDHSRVHVF